MKCIQLPYSWAVTPTSISPTKIFLHKHAVYTIPREVVLEIWLADESKTFLSSQQITLPQTHLPSEIEHLLAFLETTQLGLQRVI